MTYFDDISTFNFSLQLRKLIIEVDYTRSTIIQVIFIFSTYFLNILLTLFFYWMNGSIVNSFQNCYASVYFLFSIVAVCCYLAGALLRLGSMTEVLEKMVKLRFAVINEKDAKKDLDTIQELMQIYGSIGEICDGISAAYSFPAMLNFGLIFFFALFTFFISYKEIFNHGSLGRTTVSSIAYSIFLGSSTSSVVYLAWLMERKVSFHGTIR
jgi:hypothetical protein